MFNLTGHSRSPIMVDRPNNPLAMELEDINKEIQAVMNRSRLVLEEMTVLLYRQDPRGNRRSEAERRSGSDRRLCADRRSVDRRAVADGANDVAADRAAGRREDISSRSDDGRRRSDRRQTSDRRLPLESRQQLITRHMDALAAQNISLLQRKRVLLQGSAAGP